MSRNDKNISQDLAFHVETRKGTKLQFTPNKTGLHILDCTDYFGIGKDGYVFGKMTNMPTIGKVLSLSKGVEAILTIKGNKKNFTNCDFSKTKSTCR